MEINSFDINKEPDYIWILQRPASEEYLKDLRKTGENICKEMAENMTDAGMKMFRMFTTMGYVEYERRYFRFTFKVGVVPAPEYIRFFQRQVDEISRKQFWKGLGVERTKAKKDPKHKFYQLHDNDGN